MDSALFDQHYVSALPMGGPTTTTPLPPPPVWSLVCSQLDTPRHTNGYDCGVYICHFADRLLLNLALPTAPKTSHPFEDGLLFPSSKAPFPHPNHTSPHPSPSMFPFSDLSETAFIHYFPKTKVIMRGPWRQAGGGGATTPFPTVGDGGGFTVIV